MKLIIHLQGREIEILKVTKVDNRPVGSQPPRVSIGERDAVIAIENEHGRQVTIRIGQIVGYEWQEDPDVTLI